MVNEIIENRGKAYLVREDGVFEYAYDADEKRCVIGEKTKMPKEYKFLSLAQFRIRHAAFKGGEGGGSGPGQE